jgi:hypothetical protein
MGLGAAVIGPIIGGVASIGGALLSSNSSRQAANVQANAARDAAAVQQYMFDTTQSNLAPFIQGGGQAFGQLQTLTGSGVGGNPLTAPLTRPFQPTMEQLASTPGTRAGLVRRSHARGDRLC